MDSRLPGLGRLMIALGALNLMASAFQVVSVAAQYVIDPASIEAGELPPEAVAVLMVALAGLWIMSGLLWIVAGMRLRRHAGRGLATALFVLALIPCCSGNMLCTGAVNFAAAVYGLAVLSAARRDPVGLYG